MPSPVSWGATAPTTLTGLATLDALLGPRAWSSSTISYSFPDGASAWSPDPDTGYGPRLAGGEPWADGYRGLRDAQQAATETALEAWAAVSALAFTPVAESTTEVGELRFAFVSGTLAGGAQAYAYLPDATAFAGDVWFSRDSSSFTEAWTPGSYEYLTALHEIGHALGLKHPFEADPGNPTRLPAALDSRSYTVMSYSARPGQSGTVFSFEPTTPMQFDIAAIQRLYGAGAAHADGDTVYAYAGGGLYHQTLLDTGGIDTIVQNGSAAAVIDLRGGLNGSRVGAAVFSQEFDGSARERVANLWITRDSLIENATGGSAADLLIGNDTANALLGNAGRDTLQGGAGNDTLDGGDGKDTASYAGAARGVVVSLARASAQNTGGDGIDLLLGIENLVGSARADQLGGNGLDNTLSGGRGDDTLQGGAGADLLDGGEGVDLADYRKAGAAVVASLQADGTLGEDRLVSIEGLLGSRFADSLTGSGSGDLLDGGRGADTLAGGAGDDAYYVDEPGDRVLEPAFSGNDVVYVATSAFALAADASVERIVYTGSGPVQLTGSDENNFFVASAADDTLDGAGGVDRISYRAAPAAVQVDLAAGQASGGHGADQLIRFEQVEGSGFDDSLGGAGADELLDGGAGRDTLAGGAGNDTLAGGADLDTVAYAGALGDYAFGRNFFGELLVTDTRSADGDDGADTLFRVEQLQFADRSIDAVGGGIFRINATTQGSQSSPVVAALPDGGFVVAWRSELPTPQGAPSGAAELVVQRFDAAGVAIGEEQHLEGGRGEVAGAPALAALQDGSVVVAWNAGWNGDPGGIYLQHLAADGAPAGDVQQVSTWTHAGQIRPAITTLADGGFVVSWESQAGADGLNEAVPDIHARRFDAQSAPVGAEFHLLDGETPRAWSTATLADGGFVLSWSAYRNEGGIWGTRLYAQRFDATGQQQGAEIRLDSPSDGSQTGPFVIGLAGGGFLVAWDTGIYQRSIFAQRFDAAGASLGAAETLVPDGGNLQSLAALAALADGGFLLGWSSGTLQGSSPGRFMQRFAADGETAGAVVALESYPWDPAGFRLLSPADGGAVAIWAGIGDILGLRFDADGNADQPVLPGTDGADILRISGVGALAAAGGKGNDTYVVNERADLPIEAPGEGKDTVRASLSWTLATNLESLVLLAAGGAIDGTGNSGANRITGNAAANVIEGRGGADTLVGGAGADTASYATAAQAVRVDLAQAGAQATGGAGSDTLRSIENLLGSAWDDALYGNAGTNRLAGGAGDDSLRGGGGADVLDGGAGVDVSVHAGGAATYRFGLQGTATYTLQDLSANAPLIDTLLEIETVRFAGAEFQLAAGGMFRVNTTVDGAQSAPCVAALADGGYVAAWSSDRNDGDGTAVVAQVFDAAGVAQGAEILVNTTTTGDQGAPAIAPLRGGGFVITWDSAPSGQWQQNDVMCRVFSAAGVPESAELRVNDYTDAAQMGSRVSALANGGFVVGWSSWFQDESYDGAYARSFDASGAALSGEIRVASQTDRSQVLEAVQGLAAGGYAAIWRTPDGPTSNGADLYLRLFSTGGDALGADTPVHLPADGFQSSADAAQLANGELVVTWVSPVAGGNGQAVFARRFSADGAPLSGQIKVSDTTNFQEYLPQIDARADGGFVITWHQNTSTGQHVFIRGFDETAQPLDTWQRVDPPRQNGPNNPDVASLADGGVVVLWQGYDTGSFGVLGYRLDPSLLPVERGVDGTAGADTIDVGGAGALQARGGDGDDTLVGGGGADLLAGGDGADSFRFLVPSDGTLLIADFEPGGDRIELDVALYTAIDSGVPLDPAQFAAGAGLKSAQDADDRVVYNTTTGILYYDADGNGGVAAVPLARFGATTHPALAAADIFGIG